MILSAKSISQIFSMTFKIFHVRALLGKSEGETVTNMRKTLFER